MLSNYSIKKPFTVLVGVILIMVLGVISFTNMTTDLLPSMDLPYVMVMTTYPGASPEKIETVITKPLEQSFSTTSGVKNVISQSNENMSMVMVEYESNVNMDSALIEMNSKIDVVKGAWKDEKISSPVVLKLNPEMLPVMVAAIDADNMDTKELSEFINQEILPELEKIDGVASITATGLIEEEIEITLNQEKIDKINEKILSSVDKELSKKEKELKSAKSQISNGKAQLAAQSKEQTQKINHGLTSIEEGEKQLQDAMEQLTQQEEQLSGLKEVIELGLELINKKDEASEARLINLVEETLDEQEREGLDDVNFHSEALQKVKEALE